MSAPSEVRQQERGEAALFLDQARAIPGQAGVLLQAIGQAWVNSAAQLMVNNGEAIRWDPTVVAAVKLLAELRGES